MLCFAFPAEGMAEIDILTHPDYRWKGLATTASAAFILDWMSRDIYANWNAANPMSVGLALKLGYTEMRKYNAYVPR